MEYCNIIVTSVKTCNLFTFYFLELPRIICGKCRLNLRMRPKQPWYSNGNEKLVFFASR